MGTGASKEGTPPPRPGSSQDAPAETSRTSLPAKLRAASAAVSYGRNGRTTDDGATPQYSSRQAPPKPFPPRWRKEDIYRAVSFEQVDKHVLKAPLKLLTGTFRELVAYLTLKPGWDDLEKVRAIFRWVTSVDVFSVQCEGLAPKQSPIEYFLKIQNNAANHAHLFNGLCQLAGVHCEVVSGMNKSAAYEIGQRADRRAMGAQWNAVYVQESWQFVDTFWASACLVGKKTGEWALVDSDSNVNDDDEEEEVTEGTTQHRVNEFYFLPSPDQLIWTHYPDKREWQLLLTPITLQQFEEHFYVRERFHILGMSLTPHSRLACVLTTQDGEVDIEFYLPPENSSNLRFKYMLYRSRTRSDGSAGQSLLDRFVLFEHRQDLLRFSLRFPIKGTFKMDVYGLDVTKSDIFDLCCSYVIECPRAKPNCMPLPDCPPLGWGPVNKTKEAGLTPVTHTQAQVVTKDGFLEIRLDKDKALALHQQLKHAVLDDATLSKYCLTRVEDDAVVVYLRLPQKGEYALKMFAQDPDAVGDADNVLNYLIQCQGLTDSSKPFPNTTHGTLGRGPDAQRLGVTPVSHPGGTINVTDGKVSVTFAADPDTELVCEVHTVDGKAARQVKATRRNENGEWTFDLDLPVSGEYSLNVFAKDKNNEAEIFSVHSYLIQSDGAGQTETDSQDEEDEADDISQVQVETVETSEKEIFIPIPPDCENAVVEFHRRNGQNAPCSGQVEVIQMDGMTMFKVKMDDYGEYMLNVYTEELPGRMRNVAKYQINRRRPGDLYNHNINTIMDNLMDGRNSSDSTPTPDSSATDHDDGYTGQYSAYGEQYLSDREPTPADCDSLLTECESSLIDSEPCPLDCKPFPVDYEPWPAGCELPSVDSQPCPTDCDLSPLECELYQTDTDSRPQCDSGLCLSDTDQIVTVIDLETPLEKEDSLSPDNESGCQRENVPTENPPGKRKRPPVFANGRTYKEQRQVLARKQVQQAMDLKDQKQLEAAIARYKDTGVSDSDPVLLKAQKVLQMLAAKAELMEATQKRDLAGLEKALKNARAVNYDRQLDLQIAVASRLQEHLARLEKLRHAVLDMDQKTVAELKTYGSPPEGVHQSMMATFLLLGSPLKEVKVWRTCQALMSKTGRESMMRKIAQFDPRRVPLSVASTAKKITSNFTKEQIRDASAGAATFFIWAQGMIEEVESYGGSEQNDQMRLQK